MRLKKKKVSPLIKSQSKEQRIIIGGYHRVKHAVRIRVTYYRHFFILINLFSLFSSAFLVNGNLNGVTFMS